MELINKTNFKIGSIMGYTGICDGCQSPVEYTGELPVILLSQDSKKISVYALDYIECPNCQGKIQYFNIYTDLDVTQEFNSIKQKGPS